jgi:hypothetical protein
MEGLPVIRPESASLAHSVGYTFMKHNQNGMPAGLDDCN